MKIILSLAAACAIAAPTLAQPSNISSTNKHAWGENIGWTNWRDANGGSQGAIIGLRFAQGFVWGENVGWINLGDGSPANGSAYSNTTGADFGVNVLDDGSLDGLAWGENIGWINFGTTPYIGVDGARVEAGRLRGYAWGENVGWINLDSADLGKHVALGCPADFNNDGQVNGADLATLLANWLAPGGLPDLNGDGTVNGADLANLLANWGPC
jgi:hypothetical protein